ncbi:MAG: PAS domain-containing protein [Rhodospirillales bacterium]
MTEETDILRILEPTLELLAEAVVVTGAELDPPGPHIAFVNRAFRRLTGYAPDEVVGKSLRILDGLRTDRSLFAALHSDLQTRRRFAADADIAGKGGRPLAVEWQMVPLLDPHGGVRHWLGMLRDTRRRWDAERRRRAAEGLYRQLVETQPDLISRFLPDGTLNFVNAAYARFLGRRPQDLVGKLFFEFLSEEDAARVTARLASVAIDDPTRQFEHPMVRCDGAQRWFLWTVVALFDQHGDVLTFQSVGADITERRRAEEALEQSARRQNAILSNIPDIAWLKDADSRYLAVNEPFAHASGFAAEDIVGKTDFDLWPEALAHTYRTDDRDAMRTGSRKRIEERLVDCDGNERWVETIKTPIADDRGTVIGTTGIARDVTERRHAEEALFAEKERALVTLHSIGDAVITTDAEGRVECLNRVAEELTGWRSAAARGQPLAVVFRIVDEETGAVVPDPVRRCLEEERVVGLGNHTLLIARDGRKHAIEDTAAPIRGAHGRLLGAVLVFHDVTEARRIARQMAHDATHDALTDLVNRREFENRLEQALAGARQYGSRHALCYLDLDQFKLVNDTAGHAAGDELLKQIRSLLRGRFRGRDTLARLGGDEFGLLLDNCTVERAHKIAEMVVAVLRDFRFTWQGRTFQIGVSIGLTPVTAEAESVAQLLAQADVACYAAKERGRNRVGVYEKEGAEPPPHHRDILRAATLRDALDEQRFRLFCQPIVPLAVAGRAPVRYELLVRMIDGGGEILAPDAFIPAAERYGLMPAIDRWVIGTGFGRCRALFGAHPDSQIAVNLSGNTLDDDGLLAYVRDRFDEFALDPGRVCFEITETVAVRHLGRAAEFVREIRRMGGSVALDDFGSGLSSFSYLKALPATCLKIAGGFVRDMLDSPSDQALVAAINEVGHIMGMTTIAEYAHSEAIVDRLREMGIDYAQGYAIGRPRPLDEVALGPAPAP